MRDGAFSIRYDFCFVLGYVECEVHWTQVTTANSIGMGSLSICNVASMVATRSGAISLIDFSKFSPNAIQGCSQNRLAQCYSAELRLLNFKGKSQ